jgi:hypothetical protein
VKTENYRSLSLPEAVCRAPFRCCAFLGKELFVAVSAAKSGPWVSCLSVCKETDHPTPSSAVQVAKTSRHTALAVGHHRAAICTGDGDVHAVSTEGGCLRVLMTAKKRHAFVATGVALSPGNGSHILSVGLDSQLIATPIARHYRFLSVRSLLIVSLVVLVISIVTWFVLVG